MKVVLMKSPKVLSGLLRIIFGIKREQNVKLNIKENSEA